MRGRLRIKHPTKFLEHPWISKGFLTRARVPWMFLSALIFTCTPIERARSFLDHIEASNYLFCTNEIAIAILVQTKKDIN